MRPQLRWCPKPQLSSAPTTASTQRASTLIALADTDGWREVVSDEGEVFYYNDLTGVSQWETPAELAAAAPPSADDDAPVEDRFDDDGTILGGIIKPSSNPYITSSADRLRAEYGEDAVRGSQDRDRVEGALAADIARFKADRGISASSREDEEVGLLYRVTDTLGTVLSYNFVIIVGFFLWFLTGVGLQFGAHDTTVIVAFQGLWDVLILPLLSTHMALTFLSAGLEKVANAGSDA